MKKYKYIFHVHTKYSPDSDVKLEKLYKTLKKNNIFGIAITDHNTIQGALEFKKKYGHDIHVIIGEEIMTTEGEIIGLFLDKEIPKGLSSEETLNKIKEQRGVVYIPHPYDKKRYKTCLNENSIYKFADSIDIIEVFNGRCIEASDVDKAAELNCKLSKVGIIGSDAHSYYELKFNHLILHEKIYKDTIIEQLNNKEFYNKKTNKVIHQYTKLVILKKLIRAGKINEAFKLIYRKCKRGLYKVST